ncbi:SDR family oxidoreductase [Halalkalibacterium halodurans]|uniref:SDR family oxidoreductase n=1 Tax=Halalkalibacterium halodurans TaxID=86665 RepID=UPI002AA97016|nr:SDR family oxidoreductase [Halalkalibacterium halodurans]MDY7221198.1 SDR family oxidoreductase [Halalkalibacterium halodurans]MDY7240437.1 SDR family oxidoreductase [Halalkalibacterium halodurans]MED3647446.1 SDR family oxidoreductase [Halalkalibacterium halodurans]
MELSFQVDLTNKVAVVTGGSGVLGREFCLALAKCGAKVAVIGRTDDKLKAIVNEIIVNGGEAIAISADVLAKTDMERAREQVRTELGTCDLLINGAGGNHPKGTTQLDYLREADLHGIDQDVRTFFDLDADGIRHVFELNFLGTLIPCQVFSQDMLGKEEASIVNISSMNAFTPLTRIPAYSGAKAAVSNFTQWLAVHFSKVGIRVNAIAPGFFLTEQNYSLLVKDDGTYTDRANKILSQTPAERFGKPEELISTLLWLVDSSTSFVNGVIVPVDGGFSAYSGV